MRIRTLSFWFIYNTVIFTLIACFTKLNYNYWPFAFFPITAMSMFMVAITVGSSTRNER
jgi:hypothetical protein